MVIVLEREAVMLEDKVTVLEKVVEVQDYEKKVLQRRVEMMGKMEQRKEQEEMDDMQQSGESYDLRDRENEEEKEEKVSTLTAEIVQLRFALSASLGAREGMSAPHCTPVSSKRPKQLVQDSPPPNQLVRTSSFYTFTLPFLPQTPEPSTCLQDHSYALTPGPVFKPRA